MFKSIFCGAIIQMFFTAGLAYAQGDTVFYFGVQGNQTQTYINMDAEELNSMHDTLGFNLYSCLAAWPSKLSVIDDYMELIPDMYEGQDNVLDAYLAYQWSHYAKVEAEDEEHVIRFYNPSGTPKTVINGFAIAPYDPADSLTFEVFLDSLWFFRQTNPSDQEVSRYTYVIRVWAVDGNAFAGDTLCAGDTIATVKISTGSWWSNVHSTPVDSFAIMADTFITAGVDTLDLVFGDFLLGDHGLDYFEIATGHACSLGVDYFKIYNNNGWELMVNPNNLWTDSIVNFASSNYQYVKYWYLRDEPQFLDWAPFNKIRAALEGAGYKSGNSAWQVSDDRPASDFIDISDPPFIWPDIYPFVGGQKRERITYFPDSVHTDTTQNNLTKYSGYDGEEVWWYTPQEYGLQYALDSILIRKLDNVYTAAALSNTDLWIFPQAFAGKYKTYTDTSPGSGMDSIQYNVINDGWQWRPPTKTEIRCETAMAMCYPVDGITYWRYDSHGGGGKFYMLGMIDTNRTTRTEPWYAVRDSVKSYIRAIGSTFTSLTFNKNYPIHFGTPDASPPANAWIDTIGAVSLDTSLGNPDLGWFHIGQFTKSDDKYVMIVNRSCNDTTGGPASAISTTVKFNTSNLGLGNYVEIIDIADSVDYISYDSVLVFADTTLASSSGGRITYSTEFGPGEGRLFKLIEVDANLPNPVTDSINVAGEHILLEDWVIDDTGMVVLEGGVTIHAHPDSQVAIWCGGKIIANGTSTDSIRFLPWIEEGDTASPGDWTGIEFYSDSAAMGTFQYCAIRYAEVGIELKQDVPVTVSHCNITGNEYTGILNDEGYLSLSDSYIANNEVNGLYSEDAVDSVNNTIFMYNKPYGIRIDGTNASNDESYIIDTIVKDETGPSDDTQYGIYVLNNDYISLDRVSVGLYDQGSIKLSNSDATILDCDLVNNGEYGIYADNYGSPKVEETVFDSLHVGVNSISGAKVNLGVDPDTSNNAFYKIYYYFVYFTYSGSMGADTLWAQNCWWGSSHPSPEMFHTDSRPHVIAYSPCLSDDPSPKLAVQTPMEFALNQNYPNPFNPNTMMSFSLDQPAKTVITIYNILGQKVATPLNEYMEAGSHSVIWDGRNSSGSPVASGVYFYTIQSGDHFDSRKMLLLR